MTEELLTTDSVKVRYGRTLERQGIDPRSIFVNWCAIVEADRPGAKRCSTQCDSCAALEPQKGRDRDYEQMFLENVCREALRRFGMDCAGFKLSVERRLEVGAQRYGDTDFMRKDNMRELLDETPDLAGYALLEAQKTIYLGLEDDEQRAWHLFEAAVYGAAADWHARQALRR